MRASNDYIEFFLNSRASVARIECLEIAHPAFSKTYRIVRNMVAGVTVKHEDGRMYEYEYYPLKLKMKGLTQDLDFGLEVGLGDLGALVPHELKRIKDAGMTKTKATVVYRSYRSDILDRILEGPYRLQAKMVSYMRDGSSFNAEPTIVNNSYTGEIFDLVRFFPLRGFLYF